MRPTAVTRSAITRYDPCPTETAAIRTQLRTLLTSWGLADRAVEDTLMVVEELVANVIDHARSAFRLTVRLAGSTLHVSVFDESGEAPVVRPFDPHAVRGRGLQMIEAVSTTWGFQRHDAGKTIWAEVAA